MFKLHRDPLFKLKIWISTRFLFNKQILFGGSAPLSFFGLVLGVAALVASMSVMRGFESSLKQAMIDVTSDIQIVKKGKLIDDVADFSSQIRKIDPQIASWTRFAYTEAVLAAKGKVNGVLLQGIDIPEARKILKIDSRLQSGTLLAKERSISLGQGLAKKFGLKVDDEVYLAVSLSTPFENEAFRRQAEPYKVGAIIDFGKNEWNERLILMNLKDLQSLTEIGDRYTGLFIKLQNSDLAPELARKISEQMGPKYAVMNWYDVNRNLFEAVALEKVVIFIVVFLIVIVAAFNISSTLYVLIRQRYHDIAVLKSLGATNQFIQSLFLWQGVLIAVAGTFFGFIIGFFLSQGFMFLQKHFSLISGAIYRVDRIDVNMSVLDLVIILIATVTTCFVATYPPARKGSRLQVVTGLRKD